MNSGLMRNALWFGAGGIVVGSVVFGLLAKASDWRYTPPLVRSYSVQSQIAREMRAALNSALLLSGGPASMGAVSLGPNGSLLVTAPRSVQRGIEEVIAHVSAQKPDATPSLLFEAWVVTATPAQGADVAPTGTLTEIEPALAEIRKARGPMQFGLIEKLSTTARSSNDDSEINGAQARMRVIPTIRLGEGNAPIATAELVISLREPRQGSTQSVKSLAEMKPGELLVLGQSMLESRESGPATEIYYIVRASL